MNPSHKPLISVVILADGADLVETSVRSVFSQDLDGLEVVLVDDGRDDNAAIRRLAERDDRIRLVTAGLDEPARAKNEGLKQSEGKYIAFLSAGDTFEQGALRARLQAFEADPECRLVHGPIQLMDRAGRSLGATMGRRKTMRFDAAMHSVHLDCVMGDAELLKSISFREDVSHHADWLFFAEALRRGAASRFVERGGARVRLVKAPGLKEEQARFDSAVHDVLDWIYAQSRDEGVAPPYRQGLARPVRAVARRVCEFPLFIWCLVSRNQDACRRMLESPGLRAYLNTFMLDSLIEEIQVQCARQYLVNLKEAAQALDEDVNREILRIADELELKRIAPVLHFALDLCFFGPVGRQTGRLPARVAQADMSADAACGLILLTSFRTTGSSDALRDCVEVMLENCANPLVRAVHVLLEGDAGLLFSYLDEMQARALRTYLEKGKLVYSPIRARPDYRQLFGYANTLAPCTVAVINADIVMPEQTARQIVQARREKGAPIYALSRWNRTPNGDYLTAMKFSPPWPQWSLEERSHLEKNTTSYDCYVFDAPFPVPESLEKVFIGSMGCDLTIVASYRILGMEVRNPCLTLKTVHVDNKPDRDYLAVHALRDETGYINAVESAVLRQRDPDAPLRHGLAHARALAADTAWLGGPGNADVHNTLYRMLGHALWESLDEPRQLSYLKISIQDGKLDSARETLVRHAQAIADIRVFILWELSGVDRAVHIVDLIVDDPELEPIGYMLFGYKWQTMLHLDRAAAEAKMALTEMREGIGRILNIEGL